MLALAHRRILVTRARGQASALAEQLRALGAETILLPTIELAPPASYCALDAAITTLGSYDWLLFTSANAVLAFAARAERLRLSPDARRIAVIGPATARAVHEALGRTVDLMPPRFVAESFAEALMPHAAGATMLLVRAAVARDTLPDALRAAGAELAVAEAYRTRIPDESMVQVGGLFEAAPPDAITFTSASTAENLGALLQAAALTIPPGTVLASIGPITSQALRDLGLRPNVEAAAATIPSLVEALAVHFAAKG